MATYRRDELIRRALRMLDVVSATEAPEAEDAADAEQYLQSMLETLHGDGLIPFDLDGDEIPAPFMLPLAQKLAHAMVAEYGVFGPREANLQAWAADAQRTLYRLNAKPYAGSTLPAEYF